MNTYNTISTMVEYTDRFC